MRKLAAFFLTYALAVLGSAANGPLPHVLVTNDDGIDAPGIAALVEVLRPEYRITVCAPAGEQSSVGHGITSHAPVLVEERPASDGVRRYAIHAQPATCVRIGLSALLANDAPAMVLSGINRGDNAGRATWPSGTVAGGREGALFGLPAVAFSAARPSSGLPDFAAAARWAKLTLDRLRAAGLPRAGELVKVEVPHPASGARGILVTRVGQAPALEHRYEERPGPSGERLFVSIKRGAEHDAPGTDEEALAQGFVAITPLSLDQTDYFRIPELASISWEMPPARTAPQ
jgi:5'-nucleotidase